MEGFLIKLVRKSSNTLHLSQLYQIENFHIIRKVYCRTNYPKHRKNQLLQIFLPNTVDGQRESMTLHLE